MRGRFSWDARGKVSYEEKRRNFRNHDIHFDGHVTGHKSDTPEPINSTSTDPDAPDVLRSGHESLDSLMPVVYEHLRNIARHQLAVRDGYGTLSTTGLVHEAYLKLADQTGVGWSDRGHFFALASVAMRHILVDRARAKMAHKREGVLFRVTLDDEQIASESQPEVMLEINEAVDRLAAVEPRLAKVIECRFFGGLSEEETAQALGVTTRTVQRDWAKARMLLRRALST
jgi:RNA polymerase sigma factor (TIGR02999 family)